MPLWTSGVGSLAPPSFIAHDPGQAQIPHVVAIDLRQRAVVPGLIIAADHQPVARIGVQQHLVGHRHVILHFAAQREAGRGPATRAAAAAPSSSPEGGRAAACPEATSPIDTAEVALSA